MIVHPHELPEIVWKPTPNHGQRRGARVKRVVLHTWGVKFSTLPAEDRTYEAVVRYFQEPQSQVSAHFVYPGSARPNEITQLVRYADFAWTEEAYNPTSVEIECADAIWDWKDAQGLEQLAHVTGFLLHHFGLPPVWSHEHGFCRHGDLGAAGGNHPACPTLDLGHWRYFCRLVSKHYNAGGYRHFWGR